MKFRRGRRRQVLEMPVFGGAATLAGVYVVRTGTKALRLTVE